MRLVKAVAKRWDRAIPWSFIGLFLAFGPLAFSEDFLALTYDLGVSSTGSTFALLVLDTFLYALIGVCMWRLGTRRRARAVRDWALSLVFTWLLDLLSGFGAFDSLLWSLVSCVLYVGPQVLVLLAVVGIDDGPRVLRNIGAPLILGTFMAWVATAIAYPMLEYGASGSDAARINQEYFAQASQVIPVLLIAAIAELGLSGRRGVWASRESAAVVLYIVLVGEVAAVAALMRPDGATLAPLGLWGEYAAFVASVDAIALTLAALTLAMIPPRADAANP